MTDGGEPDEFWNGSILRQCNVSLRYLHLSCNTLSHSSYSCLPVFVLLESLSVITCLLQAFD